MKRQIILDTGPLVAILNRYDTYYHWATKQMANVQSPVLTCEAVISEAYFLLHRTQRQNRHKNGAKRPY